MKITVTLDVTPKQLAALLLQQTQVTREDDKVLTMDDVRESFDSGRPRLMHPGPAPFKEWEQDATAVAATRGSPGRPPKLTEGDIKALWRMHCEGKNYTKIGAALGVHRETVKRMVKKIAEYSK